MDIIETTKKMIAIPSVSGSKQATHEIVLYAKELFKNTSAVIEIIEKEGGSPVLYVRNNNSVSPDVAIVGHLDVVPQSEDNQFSPVEKEGRLYGRGALDMKSFAVVGIESMLFVLKQKLPISVALVLETDEEVGSHGMHYFVETHSDFLPKVVLDIDVGGSIQTMITQCKCPVFIELEAKGLSAHGSTPWEGQDAIERLMQTINTLRKKYPYYAKNERVPKNKWCNTMHVGKIFGGGTVNIVSEKAQAYLDFRLVPSFNPQQLYQDIEASLKQGVSYRVISCGSAVVMDPKNPILKKYKKIAEKILKDKISFEKIGGATTSRIFADKGAFVIYHAGSGEGMHGKGEYVEIESVLKLSEIQKAFLKAYSKIK